MRGRRATVTADSSRYGDGHPQAGAGAEPCAALAAASAVHPPSTLARGQWPPPPSGSPAAGEQLVHAVLLGSEAGVSPKASGTPPDRRVRPGGAVAARACAQSDAAAAAAAAAAATALVTAAPSSARSSGGNGTRADGVAAPHGSSPLLPNGEAPAGADASVAARIVPWSRGPGGSSGRPTPAQAGVGALYPPSERSQIQESWERLMRWSKVLTKRQGEAPCPLAAVHKVVVFGGGSFGTAMGCCLARKKCELDVVLLLRDPALCADINARHCNTKYLKDFTLPPNVRATTDAREAIAGAQYAVHAVPVQHSRAFLTGVRELLPPGVPIICVSKGLEVGSGGAMMSDVIPGALGRRQPAVFISGPSFAREVMQGRPTGVVAASRDVQLARSVQELFAGPSMRVNLTTDVVGVEICGALKNVLAIAAGIVEGLDLGHNALAALIAQGCAEIRWLATKLGAKTATMSGLSGLGDIMLTCYGDLSRNRAVGVRLGRGEALADILASSSQVAEGVATAGVVVGLASKYRVSLPVLTAVAQVLDQNLTPREAVAEIMRLPQIEEH